MRPVHGLVVCLLLSLSLAVSPGKAQTPATPAAPGVLVLLSTGYGQAGIDSYVRGLYAALLEGGVDFSRIHIEYLDLVKNPQPAYRQQIALWLADKYPASRAGVIVTMQPPALGFVLGEGAGIAPGATVLAAQARPPAQAATGGRRVFTQTATLDFSGTLQRALELFPATRQVFVLSGNSVVEQERLAEARRQFEPWTARLGFSYLDGLPLDEIEQRLRQTPPNSVIIAPGVNRDGAGQVFVPVDTIVRISQSANAPVFPVYAVSIGRGALGGMVSVLEDEGKAMARSVVDYLALPADARAGFGVSNSPPVALFDWAQIQRWGGQWDKLPPDTRFLNRPPSLWDAYRHQVLAALATIAILSALVLALLVQNRKRLHAEQSLRASQRRYQMLADNMTDLLWILDPKQQRMTYVSPSSLRVLGLDSETMTSRPMTELIPGEHTAAWLSEQQDRLAGFLARPNARHEFTSTTEMRHADGHLVTLESVAHFLRDETGQPLLMGVSRDVTEREQADRNIKQLAFFDVLTGLPNRSLLHDRLDQAIAASARNRHSGAVLFVDLDHFKTLNDTRGHGVGDRLLQQAAERLRQCVRATDTVARLGGDEFVLLLGELPTDPVSAASDVRATGEKILSAFRQDFQIQAQDYRVTASIGVCLFQGDADDREELLKRADLAMYRAKAAGRDALAFFDPDMQRVVSARAALEADMRKGLERGQFALHLQPQVDGAGRVIGAEALLRWQHPERGAVSPAEFIALAEDCGFILALGQWVLEEAGALLVAWAAQPDLADIDLAVNVSPRQFRNAGFVQQVSDMLARTQAPAQRLKLELTENVLVEDVDDVVTKITALNRVGVRFSLDDFGTGYSSLAYLKRLPLSQLKIDQTFVRDLMHDPSDALIVRTILSLGQSMGLQVIAEGVETQAQRDFLEHHGCNAFQGYLFARPMPVAAWAPWIRLPTPRNLS
jgi:diguanylate cyclase (GGDEF)-like protein/PAS domain S-box-containing protein